jgi:hypothetical protein
MAPTRVVKLALSDGRECTLRFDNRAIVALEDETGKTVNELTTRAAAGSIRAYASLVWAARLHAEPRLTVAQTIDQLDIKRIDAVAAAIAEALNIALGEDTPEPAAEASEGNAEATG